MLIKALPVILLSIVAVGCERYDVSGVRADLREIESNLGAFQYMGLDPELAVRISDLTFGKGEYGSTFVEFELSVRQQNLSFPLKSYDVSMNFETVASSGDVIYPVHVSVQMDGEHFSARFTEQLFGVDYTSSKFSGARVRPESYEWWPHLKQKPSTFE